MCIVIMANMFRTDGYLDNLLMCTVYGCIQKFISTMYNPKNCVLIHSEIHQYNQYRTEKLSGALGTCM